LPKTGFRLLGAAWIDVAAIDEGLYIVEKAWDTFGPVLKVESHENYRCRTAAAEILYNLY
jgi:hypothetical protein